MKRGLICILLALGATPLRTDIFRIGGVVNQSTEDGTGPAVNNPQLNNVANGDAYTIELSFTGSITVPGTYDLTGLNLLFSVEAPGVLENDFTSASLTVAQSDGVDQIGILACLGTGSGCNQGNELDLTISIPSAALNSVNVTPEAIAGLLPLDLLEDDGVTDIHASVTSYSYSQSAPVPEPSAFVVMIAFGIIAIVLKQTKWFQTRR